MDIKKIYISGKITGLPIDEVISKFQAAASSLSVRSVTDCLSRRSGRIR